MNRYQLIDLAIESQIVVSPVFGGTMKFLHDSRSPGMNILTIDGILEPSGSNKILVVPWADDGVDIIQVLTGEITNSLDKLTLASCI